MKKLVVLTCLIATFGVIRSTQAQGYTSGLGLRGAFASGVTYKHFLQENRAIEGIFSTIYRGYVITGLYEFHAQAFDVSGLQWYYGGGAHIGFFNGAYYFRPSGGLYETDRNYTSIGIDGIFGIEYFIQDIPITVSLDIKPYIGFINPGPDYVGGGVSIRYVW